jgi:hypothetical protein
MKFASYLRPEEHFELLIKLSLCQQTKLFVTDRGERGTRNVFQQAYPSQDFVCSHQISWKNKHTTIQIALH